MISCNFWELFFSPKAVISDFGFILSTLCEIKVIRLAKYNYVKPVSHFYTVISVTTSPIRAVDSYDERF